MTETVGSGVWASNPYLPVAYPETWEDMTRPWSFYVLAWEIYTEH